MAFNQPQFNYGFYPQFQNGAMPDVLNQYKMQYQAIQQPMMPQPPMTPSQPIDDRIWVQGIAGAKAYFVAPNTTVVLWDTEAPILYVKSADASGKPLEIEIIDLSRRGQNIPNAEPKEHKCQCGNKFAKKEDFESLQKELEFLKKELEDLKAKPKMKNKKITEELDDE
jgi:hypothetical protein